MSLRTLPVTPHIGGEEVSKAYTTEILAVRSPEELRTFTERWRPLYMLTKKQKIDKKAKDAKRYRITQNNMQELINGTFNAVVAWECIVVARTTNGVCKHATQFSCPGMHILVPMVLMEADYVATKYGVAPDLALIQMHGGLEAL